MTTRLQRMIRQTTHRPWFRSAMFSMLAVGVALLAKGVDRYVPDDVPFDVSVSAVATILGVLASSLLAVTIFSLNTIVAALAAATASVTPRAAHLLQEDPTSHNALATFLGAFLFSLVGLIALNIGYYGERGRFVLFVATLGVVAIVVATLLRWIDHVSHFGRVAETTARVEAETRKALDERLRHPHLGGLDLAGADVPPDATAVYADRVGYVQHVDMAALQAMAQACDGYTYLHVLPGTLVDPGRIVAHVSGKAPDDVAERVRDALTIEPLRTFDQDPRFGLTVLAEIASRAMSPAVNDPGTAIDVIGRCLRVLVQPPPAAHEPTHPRVHAPALDPADLVEDAFGPLAQDGAGNLAVGLRLQKALLTLARLGDARLAQAAAAQSKRALALAEHALVFDADRERLRLVATQVEAATRTAAHDDRAVQQSPTQSSRRDGA